MPRKNTRARQGAGAYHVYNRGRDREVVFRDDSDRRFFLSLLARHLSPAPRRDDRGRAYMHLRQGVVLVAYCLMGTHFHLVLWQRTEGAMARLMDSVVGSYARYFNARHGSSPALFHGEYRAKPISTARYFRWLIAYVHDNHPAGLEYEFSSHTAWLDDHRRPGWLAPGPAVRVYGELDDYRDYLDRRNSRKLIDATL